MTLIIAGFGENHYQAIFQCMKTAQNSSESVEELKWQLEQRNDELALINSVLTGLSRKLGINEIFELVGEKIREIFKAQVIDIVTYDRATNLIEDRYSYEKGDRTLVGPRAPKGFRKHIIDNGQPLII
ncbi:MAG: hypothetical protein KG003_07330, partial [Bacteroidetes bacterium]|nr:hypothetical protein [Bacteroidota bacterium]